MKTNLILIGFSGTGKSRVGAIIAELTGVKLVDTDEQVVTKTGKPIDAIFRDEGEKHFRNLETEVLKIACEQEGIVVSTGGGTITINKNYLMMKSSGIIVCLDAKPKTIYERLISKHNYASIEVRPLLMVANPINAITDIKAERMPYYGKADLTINTDEISVYEVASKAIEFWKRKMGCK